MSIITISRGSYSRGKEIAESLAKRLGYGCLARETLLEASETYNIPEAKLVRAVHDAPSVFERIVPGKKKYVAYIQAALTNNVLKDNLVYHGLAGHFLLQGISHVLKVRIIADIQQRISLVMKRDGVKEDIALMIINNDDEQRRKWSEYLYGIDTSDARLYDIVINTSRIQTKDAEELIEKTVNLEQFKTTESSKKALQDLALASTVKAKLIERKPDVEVESDDGIVTVKTAAQISHEERLKKEISVLLQTVPGIRDIRVVTSTQTTFE